MILTDFVRTLKCSYKDIKNIEGYDGYLKIIFNNPIKLEDLAASTSWFFSNTKEEIEKMIEEEKFNEQFENLLK